MKVKIKHKKEKAPTFGNWITYYWIKEEMEEIKWFPGISKNKDTNSPSMERNKNGSKEEIHSDIDIGKQQQKNLNQIHYQVWETRKITTNLQLGRKKRNNKK